MCDVGEVLGEPLVAGMSEGCRSTFPIFTYLY